MSGGDLVTKIKYITLKALVSDDYLLDTLTLKGGNALELIYHLNKRGSKDLDFSLEQDFDEDDDSVKERLLNTLKITFNEEGFDVIDFKFAKTPLSVSADMADFWGGYDIEFKVVDQGISRSYGHLNGEKRVEALRRNAVKFGDRGSPVIQIDISKYEYIGKRVKSNIEGLVVYAYAPVLILFEKLRALCQHTNEYDEIVRRSRSSGHGRARDFFDIHSILENIPDLDVYGEESLSMLRNVFAAKRVPLMLLTLIPNYRAAHEENFQSLKATIGANQGLDNFNVYYEYVMVVVNQLLSLLSKDS